MTSALLMPVSFLMKVAMKVVFAASVVAILGNVGYTPPDFGMTQGLLVYCRYMGADMTIPMWPCRSPPEGNLMADAFRMA